MTLRLEKEAIRDTASTIMQSLTELENINLNYEERRELRKKLQRLVKKNGFHLETILSNGDAVSQFVLNVFDGDVKESEDGVKVTIKFLREQKTDSGLDTQPRSYQREKVASYEWKCEIIKTILLTKPIRFQQFISELFVMKMEMLLDMKLLMANKELLPYLTLWIINLLYLNRRKILLLVGIVE